ncbi:DUF309 domain-containing protein [Streptomyces sp. AJS327]|uniref:DUF309 domain-containing protein n=1 Tax=Streptomyces sp. AJS327 TaxID=2545265 RepID=UPI0015DF2ECC|nr:DUF309 domain-containing protein [Streptomyces sp. AJS327]
MSDDREGGDPACWAALVCPECGAVRDTADPGTPCPRCGATADAEPESGPAGPERAETESAEPGPAGAEFTGTGPTAPGPETSEGAAAPARSRDRDPATGRARNARPRDGLGRPLPYGTRGVARAPEGVVRTPDETLTEAQHLLDAGMPFHAHEVLEDAWKSGPANERRLWRSLAQFAVGLTHAARGNPNGAAALLRRAADGLAPFAERPPHGVAAAALSAWARAAAADPAAVQDPPPPLRHPG